jgi:hypothetical protein
LWRPVFRWAQLGFHTFSHRELLSGCTAELYDLLYSLRWGDAVANNYGFAPAETHGPERFQLQLYAELIKLLAASGEGLSLKTCLRLAVDVEVVSAT